MSILDMDVLEFFRNVYPIASPVSHFRDWKHKRKIRRIVNDFVASRKKAMAELDAAMKQEAK